MRQISNAFLLNVAEVSAALIGLFLVGVFYYVETGFRRSSRVRDVFEPYFKASTRIVLALYSVPIGLSLTLVALETVWSRWLLLVLSIVLVGSNVDTIARVSTVVRDTGSTSLFVNEILGTVGVVGIVLVPWVLGGFHPTREDLTWAILLSFATGFLSICALVLSAFDIARFDQLGSAE
jgi:hypothetical protein